MTRTYVTRSPEETRSLGKNIGKELRGGELIALHGLLGTGKTRFVQGLAEGLGVDEPVTSPTFIYVREMTGRCPLAHFDLFRITRSDDVLELGILDYLESGWVVAVEWAEKGDPHLPEDRMDVRFFDEGETTRRIRLETSGRRTGGILERIGKFKPETAKPNQ